MYHKEIKAVLLVWVSSENEGGLAIFLLSSLSLETGVWENSTLSIFSQRRALNALLSSAEFLHFHLVDLKWELLNSTLKLNFSLSLSVCTGGGY